MLHTATFNVSAPFVCPLYPRKGQAIRLSIKTDSKIRKAILCRVEHGSVKMKTMEKTADGFSVSFRSTEKKVRLWFDLVTEEQTEAGLVNDALYLSKNGIKRTLPLWQDAFEILQDLEELPWVSEGLCYQIFPDRFCNGNPEVGARENGYVFDGHSVRTVSWNEKPLPYSEGHCLDFFNGDLDGIASKADYLRGLGVSVVYLNPIGCSCTTHRYDCTDFFHVDPKLGGDEAYARMLEVLHSRGIKVVTDISINHTGIEHPWFRNAEKGGRYSQFYCRDRKGNFVFWAGVDTLPKLNYSSNLLRRKIYRDGNSVLRKFINEPFCQDGWRFDVATDVGDSEDSHLCKEVWREVRQNLKSSSKGLYLVGEDWHDSSEYLQGDMWDATMNYIGCSRPLRRWMGEMDKFVTGNGDSPDRARPFSAMDLRDDLERQLNSLPGQMVFFQMNLIDSHDVPRLYCNTRVFDWNLYRSAVMMQFLLPGMPCIYYGDEIGLPGPMGSVEDCRYPMNWNRQEWNMDFVHLYERLGKLRSDFCEIFRDGSWSFGYCTEETLEFTREKDGKAVTLLMNRAEQDQNIDCLELAGYRDFFTDEVVSDHILLNRMESRILVKD